MSNIIRCSEDFYYLRKNILSFDESFISKEYIEDLLVNLIPRNSDGRYFIERKVSENGNFTAVFYPRFERIDISINKLREWLTVNSNELSEYLEKNSCLFKSYLCFMVLCHEIEHSYQYLIANKKWVCPCKMIQQGYKSLFDLLLPKEYIIPRPVKRVRNMISLVMYKKNENLFLLERNAQYNTMDLMADLALTNEHLDIYKAFVDMKNTFAVAGYTENSDGTLINTFKSILMKDTLNRIDKDIECLDMIERFKWGLPVDEETRGKVLSLR